MHNIINSDRMLKLASVVLAVVLGVMVVSLVANAVTTISTNIVTEGTLSVTGASTLTGDVTMSGGDDGLIITTSNSATSSIDVGCIQMYATSTATAVRLTFGTNNWATSTTQGTDANGFVAWQYGSCPI